MVLCCKLFQTIGGCIYGRNVWRLLFLKQMNWDNDMCVYVTLICVWVLMCLEFEMKSHNCFYHHNLVRFSKITKVELKSVLITIYFLYTMFFFMCWDSLSFYFHVCSFRFLAISQIPNFAVFERFLWQWISDTQSNIVFYERKKKQTPFGMKTKRDTCNIIILW